MPFKKKYIFYLLVVSSIIYTVYNSKKSFFIECFDKIILKLNPIKVQKNIFGDFHVNEKMISCALNNNALLRMKKVDQGGPLVYFNFANSFSRYDHCVGVWALIRHFKGSEQEQLVGLFHDISHTAFSHVADNIFKKENAGNDHSYQDNIHLWYIQNSAAFDICKKFNLSLELLNPDLEKYTMLERPLPDMCADRIEYNLHTALVYHLLSEDDVKNIISHLHFDTITYYKDKKIITEKTWFFDDILSAKQFALLPLHFIKSIWNSSFSMVFYKFFAHLIQYAFSKKYITKELFHFGTDEEILAILYKSNDAYVIYMLKCISNIFDVFEVVDNADEDFDEVLKGKFRGIDPLIKYNNQIKKLSEFDFDFHYLYNLTKKECSQGYRIKYKQLYNPIDFYANKSN